MEQIGEILKRTHVNLSPGTSTPGLKTSELAPAQPLDEKERAILLERLRRSLGVSSLKHTFENFDHVPGVDTAYRAFLAMATQDSVRPLLLCYGGTGNGKTYLCEALVIALYKCGVFVRVTAYGTLMRTIKTAMHPESGLLSSDMILENYCRAPRLILDDVGMGSTGSDWEFGQLEAIVCHRYHEHQMTVVTTNRNLSELPERIVRRFMDPDRGFAVLNEGRDYGALKREEAKQ